MPAELLIPSLVNGLSIGAVYIMMALGLTLMFGVMHIINFAHGAVYMLGAFAVYYLSTLWGLNFLLALALGALLLATLGVVVERVVYRPIKGGLEPTLVALLAVMIFIQSSGWVVFGVLDKNVPSVFPGLVRMGGISISVERLTIVPIVAAFVLALYFFIYRTRLGSAMRAIEQDREAAALQGVDVHQVNGLVFAVGFALAAIAGGLVAPIFVLNPVMGDFPLLKAFIIIILGGLGSLPGAILGGVILGLIDSVLTTALGFEIAFLTAFLLVILILLIRPTGLLGRA